MLDYQKAKTYWEKNTHQIVSKKFNWKIIFEIKAVKDTKTLTYVDKTFSG